MNKTMFKRAIFLDRDGVINHDPGDYTTSLKEFKILPGAIETIKKWSDKGYVIIVITNQGGIARRRYSISDFLKIDKYMGDAFLAAGINYIETYFCPHHDAISNCLCRKPHSGMIEKAIYRHGIDAQNSVMIGDKDRDMKAAQAAGVRGIKVETNQRLDLLDIKL